MLYGSHEQDRKLASHVMAVHTAGKAPPPEDGLEPLSADLLRAYIARAKQHDPFFPEDLTGALGLCRYHRALPVHQC